MEQFRLKRTSTVHPIQHPAQSRAHFTIILSAWPPWVLKPLKDSSYTASLGRYSRVAWFFHHISTRIFMLQHMAVMYLCEEAGSFSLQTLTGEVETATTFPTTSLSLFFSRMDNPRVLSLSSRVMCPSSPDLSGTFCWTCQSLSCTGDPKIFQKSPPKLWAVGSSHTP